jgi:hypothetical protein
MCSPRLKNEKIMKRATLMELVGKGSANVKYVSSLGGAGSEGVCGRNSRLPRGVSFPWRGRLARA